MARTIVAMFDSRSDAERAAEILADEGFERRQIDIRSAAAGTESRAQDEHTSWWEWLFGESDDRTYYNESLQRGGAVLSVTADDVQIERARELLEAQGADVEAQRGAGTSASSTATATASAAGEEDVIPVVEERLKVGKRPVARGGVRVYSHTVERPVEEDVRLREERVHVDRRPTDRPVQAGDDVFRDRTVELTESAEEAVVAKEARVVEEVFVGKEQDERVEHVRDTVRRTQVDVENLSEPAKQAFRRHEQDFQQHARANAQHGGLAYEDCQSAYGYGCELGSDARHAGRDWSGIEPEARRDWESRNPGTWDQFKEPIRYSWDKTRGEQRRAA
jgi:stress response protein YsnF